MLYISKSEIHELVDLHELMEVIEESLRVYENKTYDMPERMHVDRPQGTILYMPCFKEDVSCTKIVSTYPNNIKDNIAAIQGTMILNDSQTGQVLSMMDGGLITAYRTGAVGGLGIKYTSRTDCKTIGLIGTGQQGLYQVLYACSVRPIKDVYLYDLEKERLKVVKAQLENKLDGVNIHICDSSSDLLNKSEIVVTATPSDQPVMPDDEDLLKGKHFIAIGSYKLNMRELPKALYKLLDGFYVDSDLAIKESGDVIIPLNKAWVRACDIKELSSVIDQLKPSSDIRTTLFKSVGMALFDLAVSDYIYNKAIKNNVGIILD